MPASGTLSKAVRLLILALYAMLALQRSHAVPSATSDGFSQLPHPRKATPLDYQTSEVIESGGSTSFSARVPSVHCTCCSALLLLVTTSTLLPSVFLAAT
jgi:hypothetical protein